MTHLFQFICSELQSLQLHRLPDTFAGNEKQSLNLCMIPVAIDNRLHYQDILCVSRWRERWSSLQGLNLPLDRIDRWLGLLADQRPSQRFFRGNLLTKKPS